MPTFSELLNKYRSKKLVNTNRRKSATAFQRMAEQGSIGASFTAGLLLAESDQYDKEAEQLNRLKTSAELTLEERKQQTAEFTAKSLAELNKARGRGLDAKSNTEEQTGIATAEANIKATGLTSEATALNAETNRYKAENDKDYKNKFLKLQQDQLEVDAKYKAGTLNNAQYTAETGRISANSQALFRSAQVGKINIEAQFLPEQIKSGITLQDRQGQAALQNAGSGQQNANTNQAKVSGDLNIQQQKVAIDQKKANTDAFYKRGVIANAEAGNNIQAFTAESTASLNEARGENLKGKTAVIKTESKSISDLRKQQGDALTLNAQTGANKVSSDQLLKEKELKLKQSQNKVESDYKKGLITISERKVLLEEAKNENEKEYRGRVVSDAEKKTAIAETTALSKIESEKSRLELDKQLQKDNKSYRDEVLQNQRKKTSIENDYKKGIISNERKKILISDLDSKSNRDYRTALTKKASEESKVVKGDSAAARELSKKRAEAVERDSVSGEKKAEVSISSLRKEIDIKQRQLDIEDRYKRGLIDAKQRDSDLQAVQIENEKLNKSTLAGIAGENAKTARLDSKSASDLRAEQVRRGKEASKLERDAFENTKKYKDSVLELDNKRLETSTRLKNKEITLAEKTRIDRANAEKVKGNLTTAQIKSLDSKMKQEADVNKSVIELRKEQVREARIRNETLSADIKSKNKSAENLVQAQIKKMQSDSSYQKQTLQEKKRELSFNIALTTKKFKNSAEERYFKLQDSRYSQLVTIKAIKDQISETEKRSTAHEAGFFEGLGNGIFGESDETKAVNNSKQTKAEIVKAKELAFLRQKLKIFGGGK